MIKGKFMFARLPSVTKNLRRWSLCTGFSVALLGGTLAGETHAIAADPFAEAGQNNAPPPEAGGEKVAEASSMGQAASSLASALVHLPGNAYPEGEGRGLYGGSLWFSAFHGLQWPYMRHSGIGISGYTWLDSGYQSMTNGSAGTPSIHRWLQQGRFVLRVTPTYTRGNLFVQGQAELVANKSQDVNQPNIADTDDVWIRAGEWDTWDLQVGRFQAWEVYHLGMGLDLNTLEREGASGQAGLYGATFLWDRPAGPGNVAIHLYPAKLLRVELLGQMGNQQGFNTIGGRPAAILDLGWLKLKGAVEYARTSSVNVGNPGKFNRRGGGGGAEFILSPWLEFGLNGAMALVDHWDSAGNYDGAGSYTVYSYGGFLNANPGVEDLLIGVGANYATLDDEHFDVASTTHPFGKFNHLQTFAAVQYIFAKQLFIKAVVGYAKAHFNPSLSNQNEYDNTMLSGRVRLTYLF